MIESKSISVHPNNENSQIELWRMFGWSVKSSQEVYSKSSHLEQRSDGVYNVTQTTNYVKILFQRDTEMKNYQSLKSLENEFDRIIDFNYGKYKAYLIAFVIGMICIFAGFDAPNTSLIIIGFVLTIGSVFLMVMTKKKNKEKLSYNIENQQKRQEILNKCSQLL